MVLTVKQRLLIGVVRSGIDIVWFLDSISLKHLIVSGVSTLLVFFVGLGFVQSGMLSEIRSIENGLVYSIYGPPPTLTVNSGQVLGVKTKIKGNPVFLNKTNTPYVTAKSFLVIDKETSKILAEHNLEERLAPASTTKLLTALVALDTYSLDDYINVPESCLSIETTKLWLPSIEKFRVSDLLTGILVSSAGDAACALATGKTGYTEFVQKMNDLAVQIGMKNSYFSNPVGLDGYADTQYSTVQDLYLLARVATSNEFIKKSVSTKDYLLKSKDGDFILNLTNTNKLLWELPGTVGIKTGTTLDAGEVLIYEFSDDQRDLIIVVMGSSDRSSDTKALLNWTLENYIWN